MTTLSPTDSAFLWLETRNQPMHVAGLNIYSPPEGAGPDFVAKLLAQWGASLQAMPPFNQRPALVAPPLVAARARRGAPAVRTPRRKASP